MDKQMAPTSQMFSHGGIRIKDWFSDRLQQKHGTDVSIRHQQEIQCIRKLAGKNSSMASHGYPSHERKKDTVYRYVATLSSLGRLLSKADLTQPHICFLKLLCSPHS